MAAAIGALAGAGGALTRLTAIVEADTSGFALGPATKQTENFNKAWQDTNKKLEPQAKLWDKVQGAFHQLLGPLKDLIAPIAIAGGLLFAFMMAGQAGRDLFGAFGDIIGAFSDIMMAQLVPIFKAFYKLLIEDLLPVWKQLWADPSVQAAIKSVVNMLSDPSFIAAIVSIAQSLAQIIIQFARLFVLFSPTVMGVILIFFEGLAALLKSIAWTLGIIVDFQSRLWGGGGASGEDTRHGGMSPPPFVGPIVEGMGGLSASSFGGRSSGGGGAPIIQVMGNIYGTDQRSVEEFARKVMEALRTQGITNINPMR